MAAANTALERITTAIAEIGDELAARVETRRQLEVERARVCSLPRSRADLLEVLDRFLVEKRDLFSTRLREVAAPLSKDGGDVPNYSPNSDMNLLSFNGKVDASLILGLFADVARETIKTRLKASPFDDAHGITTADRKKRLASLDGQIEAISQEICELETAARAAGIRTSNREPTEEEIEVACAGGRPTGERLSKVVDRVRRQVNAG